MSAPAATVPVPLSIEAEGVPSLDADVASRLAPYRNTRSAVVCDIDATTGGLVVATRFGDTQQLHHVGMAMGARQQLTFFTEPISNCSTRPNSQRRQYLYRRDKGGSEFHQLYLFDVEENTHTLVSDGVSKHSDETWSYAGDRIAFASTKSNGKDVHIFVMDADGSNERLVLNRPGSWHIAGWSRDDTKLLVFKYMSINESYYYIVDVASGGATPVGRKEGAPENSEKVAYGFATWADAAGKGVFITADEGTDVQTLRYYDVAKGAFTKDITGKTIPWNIEDGRMSPDLSTLAFTANEDGYDKLYLLNTATHAYQSVDMVAAMAGPAAGQGLIMRLRWSRDSRQLAFTMVTPRTPGDAFMLDCAGWQSEPSGMKARRWTQSEAGGLDTLRFSQPTLHRYPSFDKLDIPVFMYKPSKAKSSKLPVLIHIHGGPEGQSRPNFVPIYQYILKELGMVVLDPNVRGSDGYGKQYLLRDNGYKREDSVKDIGALLDWISGPGQAVHGLDPDNVAVWGGSYGGYMTLAAMVHYSARLRCGVEIVGISNFVTFLEKTQEYRRDLRREEYGDERDPAMRKFLIEISPLTNAHKIDKPMLIAQGANDPRVPAGESRQIVDAVRKNGVQAQYILAKDEGHGFRKKPNIDYYQAALVSFLSKHML